MARQRPLSLLSMPLPSAKSDTSKTTTFLELIAVFDFEDLHRLHVTLKEVLDDPALGDRSHFGSQVDCKSKGQEIK